MKKLLLSLFLTVGLSIGLNAHQQPQPRLIHVSGTAEINLDPDQVVLSVSVETRDRLLSAAKAEHDKRMHQVISIAHEAGIQARYIQTDTLRMSPDFSEEKVPKLLGYEVSQSIEITLKNVGKYDLLITRLLDAGVNHVRGIEFEVADPTPYRERARAQALQAAKIKAIAMAKELGAAVGKPWEIIENPRQNSSAMSNFAGFYSPNSAVVTDGESSTVAPGQVSIRSTVLVSFELE